jgi:glycosyltransferase involved in cell wall biosynthesis
MTRRIILASMPFNIGVGGYRRSYFILPHLSRELYNEGFEVELYIPANAIRTALKFFMQETCRGKTVDYKECLEKSLHRVIETLQTLERESHYTLHTNEKALNTILSLNTKLLTSEQINARREASIGRYIIERNREVLMPIFEKITWDRVRQYYDYSGGELIVYSHHETVDALAVTSFLSKYAKGVILLMQSDIKSLIAKSILRNIRSKLLGVLAVSPQPIIESPFMARITKNIKILIPALALDPTIFTISKLKDEIKSCSAIYFGRLSKEKGFVDLLHAWCIVSQKEPKARLTLIGMPDNYEIYAVMSKYIAKFGESIRYIRYLPPIKLYREVAKHHTLIYPSYRDSFSLVILEALALGLNVVAYDIPVVRYFYRNSNMVCTVKKGDVESFAKSIIYALQEKKEPNVYTTALIKMHSSWERVARAEFNALISVISHKIA